jgi:hypothetical protein
MENEKKYTDLELAILILKGLMINTSQSPIPNPQSPIPNPH